MFSRISKVGPNRQLVLSTPPLSFWTVWFRHYQSPCDLSFKFYCNPGTWIVTRELRGKRKCWVLVGVHHVLERKLIPAEKFFPQSQSITACNKKGEISIYSDVRFDWVLYGESVISLPKPSISALELRVHFMITFISFFVLSFFEHVQ